MTLTKDSQLCMREQKPH